MRLLVIGDECYASLAAVRSLRRLVELVGWNGIFERQLVERADGTPYLVDVDPRVDGSVGLAVAALCPRPRTAHAVASLRDPLPIVHLARRALRLARG